MFTFRSTGMLHSGPKGPDILFLKIIFERDDRVNSRGYSNCTRNRVPTENRAKVFSDSRCKYRVMDRRLVTVTCIIAILIVIAAFSLFTRPITGTWVCTDRLTEHSLLTNEVTIITLRPDGTADFRSYQTYLIGRYQVRDTNGRWEPAGFGKYRVAITQGIDSSCPYFGNCTLTSSVPFGFTVDHDLVRDTIAYDHAAAPEFTAIRPFVRSIVLDCSNGCPG